MLCNLHTHSTFCDGKNEPEEIVLAALEKGFSSLGFSGHGYTPFDLHYCMKDVQVYVAEIRRLQEKYKKNIEIYLGVEEDAYSPATRRDFDYIIGSAHYCMIDGLYYAVDSDKDSFKDCVALFDNDPIAMAHAYYKPFCEYIRKRKPDIVGHFDLITKYDELETAHFLGNKDYQRVAEAYMQYAADSGCLFEVNTGAIARGLRTTPYPSENLLAILRRNGNGIVLNSDSHRADTLDYGFADVKKWLKDIGFAYTYVLYRGEFIKDFLC